MELANCWRLIPELLEDDDETSATNAHLLAALGSFDELFVPVEIRRCYDGYSWAKIETISSVKITLGRKIADSWMSGGKIACVESIRITVTTSDGRTFASDVCMAVGPFDHPDEVNTWYESVYVTPEAERRLRASEIWYHFGGCTDDGDCYDTQERQFNDELDEFWYRVAGPDEGLRRRILECLGGIRDPWRTVTATADGVVIIRFDEEPDRTLRPPAASPEAPA